MAPNHLALRLPATALAFRGYNVTNLGRTAELLANPAYGPTMERHLAVVGEAASDLLHRKIDLVARVAAGEETALETYGDAVALLIGVEMAQLELLQQHFGVDY